MVDRPGRDSDDGRFAHAPLIGWILPIAEGPSRRGRRGEACRRRRAPCRDMRRADEWAMTSKACPESSLQGAGAQDQATFAPQELSRKMTPIWFHRMRPVLPSSAVIECRADAAPKRMCLCFPGQIARRIIVQRCPSQQCRQPRPCRFAGQPVMWRRSAPCSGVSAHCSGVPASRRNLRSLSSISIPDSTVFRLPCWNRSSASPG